MSKQSDRDNRANQLNPNNDAYYSSRGIGCDRGDDDDECVSTYYGIERFDSFAVLNGCSSRTEKFAFGAVSLNGDVVYRTAIFTAPGSSIDKMAATSRLEDYLIDFAYLAWRRMKMAFSAELAIFAVFDPTESCLPWHIPFYPDNIDATRASISMDRLEISQRLRPMPDPSPDEDIFRALSCAEGRNRMDQKRQELAASKLDPLPFIEALRIAVVDDAPCWGRFTVPSTGRIMSRDLSKVNDQLLSDKTL